MNGTALDALREQLRGQLITPEDPDYESARAVYNGMIDKRPAGVVRVAQVADVIAAVNFARDNSMPLAIRGGGHSAPGFGTWDDALVIDFVNRTGVRVDPEAGTARAEAGTTWADFNHATHAFGLATPGGIVGSTGIAGLTLGGGIGYLARKHGLSCDNLLSADVVTADGKFLTANEDRNEDLFWALRGGGGNFGVVTRFGFRLSPLSTVLAGPTLWPLERSAEILSWYREFIPKAPEELNGFFAFLTVPPGPPFPEELHMQKMCGVVWCWSGEPGEADSALAEARELQPVLDGIQPMPLSVLNSAFDALYPHGEQWYWRADVVTEIPDEAVAEHVRFGEALPTWKSTMHLYPIDGAAARVGADETAWTARNGGWVQVMVGVDPEPENRDLVTDWCVSYWDALHPYSAGGGYVNMMMEEGDDRVRTTYGANYDRLAQVKAEYDPGNLFHVNQNIKPA